MVCSVECVSSNSPPRIVKTSNITGSLLCGMSLRASFLKGRVPRSGPARCICSARNSGSVRCPTLGTALAG
eukprot:91340-Alexandrium_andersonii.AAC.1